jgi:outer membrane receptor protein involved in Fe transport
MMRSALLPNPNIYDLQQIEVLRGPQGTLYGANALNGVVRILTNDPELNGFDFKARGVISTTETGGSNYAGDMAVNVPIIDGILGVRASVGDDHESGWINGPLGDHLNHSDLGNERIKLSARPTDALRIDLSAWHSQTDSPIASSQSDNTGRITAQHEQPTYTQFNAYGAKVIYDSTGFSASSMTSYIDYNSSTVTDVTPVGENATVTSTFVSDVFAEEVNLTSKLDGPWRWTIGAMYRHDKEENHQYLLFYPPPVTSLDFDRFNDSSNSGAVYGELGRRFSHDQFQWTLGLRYFHDDESTQAVGHLLSDHAACGSKLVPHEVPYNVRVVLPGI